MRTRRTRGRRGRWGEAHNGRAAHVSPRGLFSFFFVTRPNRSDFLTGRAHPHLSANPTGWIHLSRRNGHFILCILLSTFSHSRVRLYQLCIRKKKCILLIHPFLISSLNYEKRLFYYFIMYKFIVLFHLRTFSHSRMGL